MIDRIVRNISTHTFEKVEDVVEKLNHYRQLSANGLHKLSDVEIEKLQKEFASFLNIDLTFWADTGRKLSFVSLYFIKIFLHLSCYCS